MKDEIFREPLEEDNSFCAYIWNENDFFQMQWVYSIEWLKDSGPKIWIFSYSCWQRLTPEVQFEKVESLPGEIPMSESILRGLTEHAGREIYRRSEVVGSLKLVPQNFFGRVEEAAKKGFSLKLLREMSQREASSTKMT